LPITVTLLYFGQARDGSGTGEESFVLPKGSRVLDLVERAEGKHPKLKMMRGSAQLALNEEMTAGDASLKDGDLVAFLPPVAGG
jgi:molybdopterin converting factor subunit 1